MSALSLFDLGQELNAVHTRHAKVGHYHGKRPVIDQGGPALFRAGRTLHIKPITELALQGLRDLDFVSDKQDAPGSREWPRCEAPPGQIRPGL